jgi:PEP-CTERM motif
MTRRACLLLFVLLAPALTPLASAATIDPLIGVRGTLSASPPVTDPTLQAFGSCEGLDIVGDPLPEGYSCAHYDTLGMDIFSLDLQFFDVLPTQNPFLFEELTHDTANSIFNTMVRVDDITVRLFNQVDFEEFLLAQIENGLGFTGIAIFTAAGPSPGDVPASFVSIRAVNGISNVPEPAAMFLLGAGVIAAGARRRRRASGR